MNDNKSTISVITSTVALMAFICVVSICVLAYRGIQIPPELNTIASGLSGSLVSMLVKTSPTQSLPQTDGATTPVTVKNEPDNPVITKEQKS